MLAWHLPHSPSRIAALPDHEVGDNYEDGRTWLLRATDGREEVW